MDLISISIALLLSLFLFRNDIILDVVERQPLAISSFFDNRVSTNVYASVFATVVYFKAFWVSPWRGYNLKKKDLKNKLCRQDKVECNCV